MGPYMALDGFFHPLKTGAKRKRIGASELIKALQGVNNCTKKNAANIWRVATNRVDADR